jgi:hypothetical protein
MALMQWGTVWKHLTVWPNFSHHSSEQRSSIPWALPVQLDNGNILCGPKVALAWQMNHFWTALGYVHCCNMYLPQSDSSRLLSAWNHCWCTRAELPQSPWWIQEKRLAQKSPGNQLRVWATCGGSHHFTSWNAVQLHVLLLLFILY